MGNLESSGWLGERSLLGEPAAKHPKGGPSSRVDSWSCGIVHNTLQKQEKHKGKSPSTFKTHRDEIVVPLTKKKYPGQTPKVGHGKLEGEAGAFFRIIMMGSGLGTSAAQDILSLEGTRRIWASSVGVPGDTGT